MLRMFEDQIKAERHSKRNFDQIEFYTKISIEWLNNSVECEEKWTDGLVKKWNRRASTLRMSKQVI